MNSSHPSHQHGGQGVGEPANAPCQFRVGIGVVEWGDGAGPPGKGGWPRCCLGW
jgi:hypothetical protein